MFYDINTYQTDAPIKRCTILNTKQALMLLEDKSRDFNPAQRRLIHDYAETLNRAEISQKQHISGLLDPRSASTDNDWQQVHNLVHQLSFQKVPELTRTKIAELEQQLVTAGVLPQ